MPDKMSQVKEILCIPLDSLILSIASMLIIFTFMSMKVLVLPQECIRKIEYPFFEGVLGN